MLHGAIVAESLRLGGVIEGVSLVVRKLERVDAGLGGQPPHWTLLWFEADDRDADRLAEMLSDALDRAGGWYADFHSNSEVTVVFCGRVFRYRRGDRVERAKVEEYARSVGAPSAARLGGVGEAAPLRWSTSMRDFDVADSPLDEQLVALEGALATNPAVSAILRRVPQLGLADWYLGAGGVTGTVWNVLHGFDPRHGIKDYDLVYFDPRDLSAEREAVTERRAREILADVHVELDVTNEARVHLWYPERFGPTIPPYRSTEHAISTWPTTASSIGVRVHGDSLVVCAPFGLRDLFAMVVRPNKAIVTEHVYNDKAGRWADHWPRLRVLPW